MEIKKLALGHIKANCYLVKSEKAAVVIDPGFNSAEVEEFLSSNLNLERLILLTHCHFDHIGGAKRLRELTGTKIAIGKIDSVGLGDSELNFSKRFHAKVEPFCADIELEDGEKITVGDLEFECLATPGHTSGGMCFLVGESLFSGDTLFCETVGRTDAPTGNSDALLKSIKKLLTLNDNIKVYPGHMGETTICHEKKYNPWR